MPVRTLSQQSYTVGIICALDVEKAAVEATLDEEHGRVEKAVGDDNVYTFGSIGAHNVVVACLPAGVMGKAFVVYGLGGIGKTQLCVEYVR
jgi:nucleoside phosphorylase